MANRPSGSMQEGKKCFPEKHKFYSYKMEVAARPNRLASIFSPHYPSSVFDISILTQRISEHQFLTEKCNKDQEITEKEDSNSENPSHWAVLADKGYQGAQEMLRCYITYKKLAQGSLSPDQERHKRKTSQDHIVVEE